MTLLYLDYQASTPMCDEAILAMEPLLRDCQANPHSAQHEAGRRALGHVESARRRVADLIGADACDVIFTSGATESNNLALKGIAKFPAGERRRILVGATEHKSVLAAAKALQAHGDIKKEHKGLFYEINEVPVDDQGYIDAAVLERLLGDDVLLVSIGLANGEIGTIQDISKLTQLVHACGALFHCDATQGVMHQKIDVEELGVDFLSLSSHKIAGPKGIGALYIAKGMESNLRPLISGGGQEKDKRSGTLPTFLCAGFGAAVQRLQKKGEQIRRDCQQARDEFWQALSVATQCRLVGPALSERHCSNLSVEFIGADAQDLLGRLYSKVAASTGSACSSGIPEPSHVLKAIGLEGDQMDSIVRFSFGRRLEKHEIAFAVQNIVDVGETP